MRLVQSTVVAASAASAAVSVSFATSAGWETIARWPEATSTVLAPRSSLPPRDVLAIAHRATGVWVPNDGEIMEPAAVTTDALLGATDEDH
jgi:hypothetical protein